MKSYFYIIQKCLGSNNIIQPCNFKRNFIEEYIKNVKCKTDIDCVICYFFYDFIFNLYKYNNFIFYDEITREKQIIADLFQKTKVSKFFILQKLLKNMFYSDDMKEKIHEIFYKIQRTYYGFSRLAYIFKFKRANIPIKTDLFMNNIDISKKKYIEIFQNNSIYYFTLFDIINILNTQLGYAPSFIPKPKLCKNPYNNIPFSSSILLNIYLYIKNSNYKIPILLQKYYECNFDIDNFKNENENLIVENAIKRFLYKGDSIRIEHFIREMLEDYIPSLEIDKDFPTNILIDIMRPYLHLYMITIYLKKTDKYINSKKLLKSKLKLFYLYNKNFGRKFIKLIKNIDSNSFKFKNIEYNTRYLPFDKLNENIFKDRSKNEINNITNNLILLDL